MQQDIYRQTFGLSQSLIKDFRHKSPSSWRKIHIDKQLDLDKNEDNFVFGSLIDTLAFTPHLLNERYYVAEIVLPSKAIETIIKNVYNALSKRNLELQLLNEGNIPEPIELLPISLENNKDLILDYANEYCEKEGDKKGWNTGWKDDTRVNKIIDQGGVYFELLAKAGGRKIITSDMNMQALNLIDILKEDSTSRDYFIATSENELIFQQEIFIDYESDEFPGKKIPLKGALDIIRIDHKNQTIQIADFKSSFSAFDFIQSVRKFDYVGQLSFYNFILAEWLKTFCEGIYCNYRLIMPVNVVIDIKDKVPYVYEYNSNDITLSRDGNKQFLFELHQTHDHNQRIRKGWKEVLDEICWHYFTDQWLKPKEAYLNGKIAINLLND